MTQLKRVEKEQQLASITASVMEHENSDQSVVKLDKPDNVDPSEDLKAIIEEVDKQLNIQGICVSYRFNINYDYQNPVCYLACYVFLRLLFKVIYFHYFHYSLIPEILTDEKF